ncbi:MAG: aminodeoxychorismate synthase component I [Solirubrobacteraceae bacterium]
MRATLFREPLDADASPADAARVLRGEERPFALIGAWAGGGALLGSRPVRVAVPGTDLFGLLDDQPEVLVPEDVPADVVGGGWVGFLGFELRHAVERGHPPPPRPIAVPDGDLAFYDHVLRRDAGGRWWFEALVTPEREAAILARRDELAARLAHPPGARPFATGEWAWTPSPAGHARAVDACVERIAAGDLFQANLCTRLDGRLTGDALDLFATAAAALPTDRAAFVAGPWGTVASLSPELFLARRGRAVRSAPIKGTRPAGGREELEASAKDRAENVMIVDLVRNDLGRVCVPGGVRVTALAEVRPHAGVWHMVSEVEGELREDVGHADLLRATFPPGSVTGAPKLAALDVIAELESTGREAYTGSVGFASPLAGLELSVAIRTFEVRGPRIWLGAGGGITADSVGEDEAREAAAKAAPLLAAINAGGPPDARGEIGPPRIVRRGPRPVPRPDPAAGLYETIRVVHGEAQALGDHLARLGRSLRALYGLPLPDALAERATRAAVGHRRARLRIDVFPGEDAQLAITPLGEIPPAVLRPVVVPGGLGAHKWRDRRLLESHEDDDPGTLPLLVDADGLVLETSRTAIVVRGADGRLYAPPTDGRILPSVTAAHAGARPRPLTLADLDAAAEVYVASALRGLSRAARTPAG